MPTEGKKENTKNYNVQFNRTRILYLYYLNTSAVYFEFVNYLSYTQARYYRRRKALKGLLRRDEGLQGNVGDSPQCT